MAIMMAMEENNWVKVYNTNNSLLYSKPIDKSRGDALMGFTSNAVTIKESNWIKVYDEKGNTITSKPV